MQTITNSNSKNHTNHLYNLKENDIIHKIGKPKHINAESIKIPTGTSRKMTALYRTYPTKPSHPGPETSRPGTSRYVAHNNAGSRAEFAVAGNWRSGWRRICTQRCGIRKVGIISNNYRALRVNYAAGGRRPMVRGLFESLCVLRFCWMCLVGVYNIFMLLYVRGLHDQFMLIFCAMSLRLHVTIFWFCKCCVKKF